MVRAGPAPLEEPRRAAGIERGGKEHLLEEVERDAARARAREEKAARSQKLECEPVDVLVAAARLVDVRLSLRERGRIRHDEVTALAGRDPDPQVVEDVGLPRLDARSRPLAGLPVEGVVLARELERAPRHVD